MTPKSELRFGRKRVDDVREKKGEDVLQREGGSCLWEWDDGKERRAHTKHHQTTTDGFKKVERKESSAPGRPQVVICEFMVKGDKACSSGEFVENSLCRRARRDRSNVKQLFLVVATQSAAAIPHRPGYTEAWHYLLIDSKKLSSF